MEPDQIALKILPGRWAVCRLGPEQEQPEWARAGEILSLTWTRTELSIVCEERWVPPEQVAERGWRALQVQGPLDFGLIGVLAVIAAALAEAGISIFVLSTYDTDTIFVKEIWLERAVVALRTDGFQVELPE